MTITAKCLVIPDAHVPFHDERALKLVKLVARKAKPTHGVCIGDWADLYAVNAHGFDPARRADLRTELDAARAELKSVRGLFDVFKFVAGNHEWRYDRYIAEKAPKLHGVAPTMRENLGIASKDWTEYRDHMYIGKMGFTHDLGYSGANALKQTLDAFGGNVTFGHTHRGGTLFSGSEKGERHVGLNVGWLGDPKAADYMHGVNKRFWQLGFGWINFDDSGLCFAHFCPIVNYSCEVDGKVYSV